MGDLLGFDEVNHRTKRTMLPGLVNVCELENPPIFNGEIHYFIHFYGYFQ